MRIRGRLLKVSRKSKKLFELLFYRIFRKTIVFYTFDLVQKLNFLEKGKGKTTFQIH